MAAESLYFRMEVLGSSEAAAKLDTMTGSLRRVGAASATARRESMGFGAALSRHANTFLGVGLTAGVAVKKFVDFTQQMTMIKTQAGANSAELKLQTKNMLDLAIATGQPPAELAKGLFHLESLGFRQAAAYNMMKAAARGAAIGNSTLEDTTNALGHVFAQHIKGVTSADQLMGMFNSTVGTSNIRLSQLVETLGHGTVANLQAFGGSIQDVLAMTATLGKAGIVGSSAATSIRQAISRLAAPISGTAVKMLEKLGIAPKQLAIDLQGPRGVYAMLNDLNTALMHKYPGWSKLARAQREGDIAAITGGSRMGAGIQVLMQNLPYLNNEYTVLNKGNDTFHQAWKDFTKTAPYYMGVLRALADVLLIKIGGAIFWVVDQAIKLFDAFKKGHPWAVAIVVVLGGLAAGFIAVQVALLAVNAASAITAVFLGAGTLTSVIRMIPQITSLAEAFTVMGIALDSLTVMNVIAIIAGLAAAFYLLYTKSKWVRDHAKELAVLILGIGAAFLTFKANMAAAAADSVVQAGIMRGSFMSMLGPIGLVIAAVMTLNALFSNDKLKSLPKTVHTDAQFKKWVDSQGGGFAYPKLLQAWHNAGRPHGDINKGLRTHHNMTDQQMATQRSLTAGTFHAPDPYYRPGFTGDSLNSVPWRRQVTPARSRYDHLSDSPKELHTHVTVQVDGQTLATATAKQGLQQKARR